ncbi:MAG: outer membrane lipoprotein-sorting protein [Armatimonadota bacterium]
MLRTIWLSAFVLGAAVAMQVTAHAVTGDEIVEKALQLQREIEDYTARVTVETDIPDVDIPARSVTVYYKRPDKVRVVSEKLVIVPRSALQLHSLGSKIIDDADCHLQGQKTVGGRLLYSVKVIPRAKKNPNRAVIWIWGDTWTPQRLEAYRGPELKAKVRWTHQKVNNSYWLPETITFEAVGENLPGRKSGTITLRFSNFRINTGLSDDIFKREE